MTNETYAGRFPDFTIAYPGVLLNLRPENYLFDHPALRGVYCVGIFPDVNQSDNILLGQQTLRNTFVEYDIDNSKIGFASVDCVTLRQKHTSDETTNLWRVIAIVFIIVACCQLVVGFAYRFRNRLKEWFRSFSFEKLTWHRLEDEDEVEAREAGNGDISNHVVEMTQNVPLNQDDL
jgi:hypothetical protein